MAGERTLGASLSRTAIRLRATVSLLALMPVLASAAGSTDEAALARVEFMAKQSKVSEALVLDEIMGRLGRIENTTRDLRILIEAMPVRTAPAAAPVPVAPAPTAPPVTVVPKPEAPICTPAMPSVLDDDADVASTVTLSMGQLAGAGAALALLIGFLVWRGRRSGSAPTVKSHHDAMPPSGSAHSHDSLPLWEPTSSHSTASRPDSLVPSLSQPPAYATSALSPNPASVAGQTASIAHGTNADIPAVSGTQSFSATTTGSSTAAAVVGDAFDPTLELAEIMLSMGLASGAAQALEEHIRANPREALVHWIKLLEVYREDGHRSDFEKAARDLQKNFNIRATDWLHSGASTPTLEEFERVITEVIRLWPSPEDCLRYLSHLLDDNRDGMRQGFPQAVAEEILLLIAIVKTVHPEAAAAVAAKPSTESEPA